MENKNNLPEAAAVAYTNIKTPKGYHWSFTMRCNTVGDLVDQIEKMEEVFAKKTWEAEEIRYAGGKGYPKREVEYVEGKKCPVCEGRVVKGTNPKGPEFKCENQKFDFKTKIVSGCKWCDWGKNSLKKTVSTEVLNDVIPEYI